MMAAPHASVPPPIRCPLDASALEGATCPECGLQLGSKGWEAAHELRDVIYQWGKLIGQLREARELLEDVLADQRSRRAQ